MGFSFLFFFMPQKYTQIYARTVIRILLRTFSGLGTLQICSNLNQFNLFKSQKYSSEEDLYSKRRLFKEKGRWFPKNQIGLPTVWQEWSGLRWKRQKKSIKRRQMHTKSRNWRRGKTLIYMQQWHINALREKGTDTVEHIVILWCILALCFDRCFLINSFSI